MMELTSNGQGVAVDAYGHQLKRPDGTVSSWVEGNVCRQQRLLHDKHMGGCGCVWAATEMP